MARRCKKGDMVQVMVGKNKGTRGRIVEVLTQSDRVRIEGVAVVRRHLAPQKDPKRPEGGIVDKLGSVHISNVMPLDPKDDKPTRVRFGDRGGKKVRLAVRSGEALA